MPERSREAASPRRGDGVDRRAETVPRALLRDDIGDDVGREIAVDEDLTSRRQSLRRRPLDIRDADQVEDVHVLRGRPRRSLSGPRDRDIFRRPASSAVTMREPSTPRLQDARARRCRPRRRQPSRRGPDICGESRPRFLATFRATPPKPVASDGLEVCGMIRLGRAIFPRRASRRSTKTTRLGSSAAHIAAQDLPFLDQRDDARGDCGSWSGRARRILPPRDGFATMASSIGVLLPSSSSDAISSCLGR